jgi:2-polyprenyl-3-methyl-5-hydroxy-6-metoxy-1,4-benzoquinol methylase
MNDAIPTPSTSGHYAVKQISSRVPILNWSHRTRFELARRLVAPFAGGRLLDYGCGDATFLAGVRDLFPDSSGANLDERETEACRSRFAGAASPQLMVTRDLAAPEHRHAYDVVTCMEVLEHCVGGDVDSVLDDLTRAVAAGGVVIISVPIETGPPLLAKQIVRRAAALRIHDYRYNERYRAGELLTMLFADANTAIDRTVHANTLGSHHSHKGFNWRAMRRRVGQTFEITRAVFSPLGWLGGLANSQAWFICRPPRT